MMILINPLLPSQNTNKVSPQKTYRSASPTIVLVLENRELYPTVGALRHVVQPLHVGLTLADLAVQRTQDFAADAQRGLARVQALDDLMEGVEPVLLLTTGGRVQLHCLVVVLDVKRVGSHEVVALLHLEVVDVEACAKRILRPG